MCIRDRIVDGKPIAEGHMAHHPLNPIWASELAALMKPQGKYPCMIIGEELLSCSEEMIMEEVKKFSENNSHFYIIPDYTTDNQGQKIAEVFGKERLLLSLIHISLIKIVYPAENKGESSWLIRYSHSLPSANLQSMITMGLFFLVSF